MNDSFKSTVTSILRKNRRPKKICYSSALRIAYLTFSIAVSTSKTNFNYVYEYFSITYDLTRSINNFF